MLVSFFVDLASSRSYHGEASVRNKRKIKEKKKKKRNKRRVDAKTETEFDNHDGWQ